ncbi:MAG TPA: hypothetical protein VEK15_27800 [Vicinamibacteria bacterium]|nr:hypothetical protein [Vicinamibacteria bacterium]
MTKHWLGWLGILSMNFVAGRAVYAQAAIEVPMSKGPDARAACVPGNAGEWVFKIEEIEGKVTKVVVSVFKNAHPTEVDGELRICADHPDPRPQALCPDIPENTVGEIVGSLTLTKPQIGKTAALPLEDGPYCVAVLRSGRGRLVMSVNPPQ